MATKPPLVPKVLTEVNPVVTSDNLIISIAMGIPLINLEQVQYHIAAIFTVIFFFHLVRRDPDRAELLCMDFLQVLVGVGD